MSDKSKVKMGGIIRMAYLIGMEVVAEGVETREQVECLIQLDCDMIQGYYYAKPMQIESYEVYFNQNTKALEG